MDFHTTSLLGTLASRYGVAVQDFTSSWRSGLAFLAVIKAIDSSLVDMKQALEKSPRENLEDAFTTAHNHLGIPRLLEPEGNLFIPKCLLQAFGIYRLISGAL